MVKEGAEKTGLLMGDEGLPLVLVGPPRAVRGEFRLSNPGGQKVVVRQPLLRTTAAPARTQKGSAEGEAAHVLRRIVLRPGQTRPVPVALSLDPRTPPGSYQARLEIAGEKRDVVVHVTEEVALSRLDLSTLQATRIADARGSPTKAEFPVHRRRRASVAVMALLALAAGVATWLVRPF